MTVTPAEHEQREVRVGLVYGFTAYAWWGLFTAVYMKFVLQRVPVMEVVWHRVVWCVVLLAVLVAVRRRWGTLLDVWRRRGTFLVLVASAALIAINWYLFARAVASNQLIQASLGYFINPLLSVALGFVFLGERLRVAQFISVVIALVAVTYLTIAKGAVPGLALGMALSFGLYELLRKVARVEAITGLLVETTLLLPFAGVYLAWLAAEGVGKFVAGGWGISLVLMVAGPITAIPLLLFVAAAKRLRLATVGFLQYLAPTGQFLLAVLVYHEAFDYRMGIAFAGIWAALALYSLDAVRVQRARR
ncbi:MAG TPA: EamA family transporter RarD [Phycisphaerae bacterium]|nr:EamA family transporter RarD [Phycisphaerae bacterium]